MRPPPARWRSGPLATGPRAAPWRTERAEERAIWIVNRDATGDVGNEQRRDIGAICDGVHQGELGVLQCVDGIVHVRAERVSRGHERKERAERERVRERLEVERINPREFLSLPWERAKALNQLVLLINKVI